MATSTRRRSGAPWTRSPIWVGTGTTSARSRPPARASKETNSSSIGRFNPCKAAPPGTDENHTAPLSGTGKRPEILAQSRSIGGHAGVSPVGGTGISGGGERIYRPGVAASFRQNHVSLVSPGRFRADGLPPPGGKDPAVRPHAG